MRGYSTPKGDDCTVHISAGTFGLLSVMNYSLTYFLPGVSQGYPPPGGVFWA
jgi:hypothetical protein